MSEHVLLVKELLPEQQSKVDSVGDYDVVQVPSILLCGLLVNYYIIDRNTDAIVYLATNLPDASATAALLSGAGSPAREAQAYRGVIQ